MVLDEERASSVEGLVLVESSEAEDLHACRVRRHDRVLDVAVDARPLAAKEELHGEGRGDPGLDAMLKELVLVRDEDAADEADDEEEGEAERPEDVHDEVGAEGMGGKRARPVGSQEGEGEEEEHEAERLT